MPNHDFPIWDKSDPGKSINEHYRWLTGKAEEQIDWYEARRRPQRKWSTRSRGASLIFATLGALCPLLAPIKALKDYDLPVLGYVFLALGALIMAFDRLYGFSSSWMRYASTQLNLDIALREFQFEWAQLQSQSHTTAEAFQKLKDFSAKFDGFLKQETDAWISEFRSNIAELEKVLKTGAEERKPGGIQLKVANARDFKKITVSLNNVPRKELEGVSEALLDMVAPGSHELLLVATDVNGKEHRETKVVTVAANATVAIDVAIP